MEQLKINKIVTILTILFFVGSTAAAQEKKAFPSLNRTVHIEKDNRGTTTLVVTETSTGTVLKSTVVETESFWSSMPASYDGDVKFVVILMREYFFIYNVLGDKLSARIFPVDSIKISRIIL